MPPINDIYIISNHRFQFHPSFLLTKGKILNNFTKRHTDGPNDYRPGYRNTCVYSFVVEWKENIYRLSIICYTRKSMGNFLEKNCVGLHLRRKIRDFQVEHNGMCQYKDFCLKDDMKRSIHLKSLVPPDEDLTPAFFKRNPESKWKGKFKKKKLKWAAFEWKDKDNNVRIRIDKMIELREFINQYGFVSSFAHQINCFVNKHSPTRIQNLQLHYMALLQTSQV